MVALVVLVLVEVLVGRQPWIWRQMPARSPIGVFFALESKVIRPARRPLILIMGSSRIRDALAPRTMEQALDLPPGSVINLGLTSGTTFDALLLYRRHRMKFARAKLLIFGVEDWHFNRGMHPTLRDRCFGGLADRIGPFRTGDTIELLVGWAWRTLDTRAVILKVVKNFLNGSTDSGDDTVISPDGRVIWRKTERDVWRKKVDVTVSVVQNYQHFAPSPGRYRQLTQLISLARRDGLAVWIVQVPLRDAYLALVQARQKKAYTQYRKMVFDLARRFPGVNIKFYEKASTVGIPQYYFYDYGHLTIFGCQKMTQLLAVAIKKSGVLSNLVRLHNRNH